MSGGLVGVDRIRGMKRGAAAGAILCALVLAAPASATPVATNDDQYEGLGRVFPDPLANCQRGGDDSPCSPFAQGNLPATQFIQYQEFISAMRYMNTSDAHKEWKNYMEVLPLDGKLGEGSGTKAGPDMFPGNNLTDLEFSPRKENMSAGIPTTGTGRSRSDLFVVRVTDETVPDKGKKRYALSLSIHGIERAGAEGGIRAIEDLVTAGTAGNAGKPVLPRAVGASPTFGEVLRNTIIYFTTPNPDGWRRGSFTSEGGVFFQRYNGNGVDLNRDWPDVGFQHRYYSALSEPETQAYESFFRGVERNGGQFAAGDDLHGQAEDDALSFTMMPHGKHDYEKDLRLRTTAQKIHAGTYEMVKWSPMVQPLSEPRGGAPGCLPGAIGPTCLKIYAQTWGTVYDTINYTTAGTLGDWFDSTRGMGADGIDNEMSFSHLDKNIVFDPHTEQMHVDGNKALIWAHLTTMLNPARGDYDAPGRKGYVPNERLTRKASSAPPAPEGTVPQAALGPKVEQSGIFTFKVKQGPQTNTPDDGADAGKNIFNGGLRVQVTAPNAQGVGTGGAHLQVQCKGCDKHREKSTDTNADWITVAEDFNQSGLYLQSGATATVNNPQSFFTDKDGKDKPVEWRAVVRQGTPVTTGSQAPAAGNFEVHFTSGPAADDGNVGGDNPPNIRAYDVANTDVFNDLNGDMEPGLPGFDAVSPRDVLNGRESLSHLDSIVLADNPLPGFKGLYGTGAIGDPPDNRDISFSPTVPGGFDPSVQAPDQRAPGTYTRIDFELPSDRPAGGMRIRIDWDVSEFDFDMYLYRRLGSGKLVLAGSSSNLQGTTNFEEINIRDQLPTGNYELYVDNFAAADPRWTGKIEFARVSAPTGDTGAYSDAEKNTWMAKLKEFVEGGGNLVLTDGALRALPDLTGMPFAAVAPATVYAGQITFADDEGVSTVKDELAQKPVTIEQQGARFNTGMRRQTFEPTPLGFSIQPDTRSNADQSNARQWDVDAKAFEAAGGRIAGTSVDPGDRDAAPVHERAAFGEIKLGKGQIRIVGALLPQPSTEFNHPLGVEPYSLTYTGHILLRNVLEVPQILSSPTIGGRFFISGRAVKMRKNRAAVRVSCRGSLACAGTLSLTTRIRERVRGRIRKRTITLGKAKVNVASKSPNRVLQVSIRKSARRYVLRGRRVRVLATAPIAFSDGKRGIARRQFWFYRPTTRSNRKR
jgi:hypothetical protein